MILKMKCLKIKSGLSSDWRRMSVEKEIATDKNTCYK